MTSRLDRLVLLLDTGSPVIRNTAADQLADIQKAHPHELYNLLGRVVPFLQYQSWDTRVAAARAIGGIIDNAPNWDPNQNEEEAIRLKVELSGEVALESTKAEDPDAAAIISAEDRFNFADFNVLNIIKNGQALLGSAGREYDNNLEGLSNEERLARAKQSITARLGLGAEYMDDEILTTHDVGAPVKQMSKPASPMPAARVEMPRPPSREVTADGEEALSARQRNMMKRKAKLVGRNGGNKVRVIDVSGTPTGGTPQGDETAVDYIAVTDQAQNDAKVVVEHKRVADPAATLRSATERDAWPLEALTELLSIDLFDTKWERRHGAAMALREVFRAQGRCAGRLLKSTRGRNDSLNEAFLDDMACRICCVFALDRFGDYVADQVVAPVRESVSQTLAALLKHLPQRSIVATFGLLCQLVYQPGLEKAVWEVTHGGMLGLKYLVAMRKDVILSDDALMDKLFAVVFTGLAHADDDVRAVAAATLIPVAEDLIARKPAVIDDLLQVLWDCLADMRDDLSASTGSVMDLLAKLCSLGPVIASMQRKATEDAARTFANLMPRLYAFFRHTITTVRTAVMRAIQAFVIADRDQCTSWVDDRLLQLVFQNLLVEQNITVLELSFEFWTTCLDSVGARKRLYVESLEPSLDLVSTPIGRGRHSFPLNRGHLIRPSGRTYGSAVLPQSDAPNRRGKKKADTVIVEHSHNIDGPMLDGDVELVGFGTMIRARTYAARALGRLLSHWPSDAVTRLLTSSFLHRLSSGSSGSSTPRYINAALLQELLEHTQVEGIKSAVHSLCEPLLTPSQDLFYANTASSLFALRAQCQSLCNTFVEVGRVTRDKVPHLPPVQATGGGGPDQFALDDARRLMGEHFDRLKRSMQGSFKGSTAKAIEQAHRICSQALEQAINVKAAEDCRVSAAAAGALVASGELPKKLNPIIRSLMENTKTEDEPFIQKRSARSLAVFVAVCHGCGRTAALDKLVKNLCAFLCIDTAKTPEFHRHLVLTDSIYSVKRDAQIIEASMSSPGERQDAIIKRMGARMALEEMARKFGADLFQVVPTLKHCIYDPLQWVSDFQNTLPTADNFSTRGQELVDCLCILGDLISCFDPVLQKQVLHQAPQILSALTSEYAAIRFAAASCFAACCQAVTIEGMQVAIEEVVPMIGNTASLRHRQGAIEAVNLLVQVMDVRILPYIIFLIVPVLGRMSDSNDDIRNLATRTFAQLVKLVPLEAGIPDPPGISEELLAGRNNERRFIHQMLDGSKVEHFKIPVAIKADLRSYQQDGVNWLAFLNKYQLHGILCDDMGLGKTLQTICIIASDHHNRKAQHKLTGADEWSALPSLIVCPPTLTGHWQYEIANYAPFLEVINYVGSPAERRKLYARIATADVVVTSYDVVRNDVDVLCRQNWNYCVLDEGHIIKNAKAKLTQAVKLMKAGHRLILSGTPIQNNVLELWSLFDFLMPGFLGTEKSFYARYAKPIASSREAKSSSKEHEAGMLALEALHKQVLPFLLRRLKEDVLSDLPPKIIQDYYCNLSPLQQSLYTDFTNSQAQTVVNETSGDSDKSGKTHVFQALQYMRKLCNHPALVLKETHPKYASTVKSLKSQGSTLSDVKHGPKLLALRDLLLDCGLGSQHADSSPLVTSAVNQHRALVFCQLKDMVDMVEQEVFKNLLPTVSYMRLDGSTEPRHRQAAVQKFNADPSIDVLLLTTHVGGLGLNLTGADTVIFVEHDWNPMKDLQAMDRAHRLGQKKTVNVYRLITKNTLEEKIMGLQRFKLNIASTVVNQQNSGLATMGTDQILDLFSTENTEEKPRASNDDGLDAQGNLIAMGGQKALFDDLQELHTHSEYADFNDLSTFVSSL
ncbi:hypothetical protein BCR37DRAFT_387607 [Protomyces lactucae-debilis]|uniref:TATA-binding protein-associated factor mot1 n=1 Tax=Protomyces lactucae-debilis TaxID=2754530 RepID=A0A1Y2FE10_PROLT|nr:uncharacterized protein BCR37DRAFT_387607 [Protomyces lactucae-debilis]ORY82149.1 hypothetical protein BCR37DRAFT_387607 [Protomyces lactucae-debilis]